MGACIRGTNSRNLIVGDTSVKDSSSDYKYVKCNRQVIPCQERYSKSQLMSLVDQHKSLNAPKLVISSNSLLIRRKAMITVQSGLNAVN